MHFCLRFVAFMSVKICVGLTCSSLSSLVVVFFFFRFLLFSHSLVKYFGIFRFFSAKFRQE